MTPLNGTTSSGKMVRVADLRAYLLAKGWKIKPFQRPQVIRFEGPLDDEGQPLVLLLPFSEQLRDYSLRIEEILRTLSVLENRSTAETVRNIVTPTSDILHLRLESPDTRTGTIELGFVERFFASMKDLLVFAACSQFEPKTYYQRALKKAVLFADKCRFRPAAAGSFRVDVEAPLTPPANEAQILLGDFPIERLVLTSLIQGLGALQAAIDDGQTGQFLAHPPRHFNANLCDAILGMKPDSPDVQWQIGVSWSPAWPVDGLTVPGSVSFEDRSFEQIAAIGRALRTGNKPRAGTLRGRVIRLSGKDPLHGESGPLTVVLALDNQDTPSHVEIALGPEQYRQAGEAHLRGQRIAVKGIFDRLGRKWQLLDVSDFQVLSEAVI